MNKPLYLILFMLVLSLTAAITKGDGPSGSTVSKGRPNKISVSAVTISRPPTVAASGRSGQAVCLAPYEEQNGLVVIEAENLTLPTGWQIKNNAPGYTGTGFISWVNAENYTTPGIGMIETTVNITKTGKYSFQWYNKVGKGTAGNEHNDSWLRFPDASDFYAEKGALRVYPKGSGKTPVAFGAGGDGWFKLFYNAAGLVWAWNTLANDEDGMPVKVEFNAPGVYKLQISARASDHLLDRIIMYHTSVSAASAQELTNPETRCYGPADNRPPVVASPLSNQPATIGQAIAYSFPATTFTDPDGDAITYSASLGSGSVLPNWLSFNVSTRTFTGIPPGNSPASLAVRLTANDGKNGTVTTTFSFNISASTTNTVPVLAAISSQTVTVGKSLSFTVQATDADAPPQTLTYSVVSPAQATIDPSTGAFSWTPTATGNTNVVIQVTDAGTPALTAQAFIPVTVVLPFSQQSVTGFSLINADNEQEINLIANGAKINLATLPTRNINIRVNTNPSPVGSVRMVLSGQQARTQVDNGLPYALFGDTNGDYKNWTPALGNYTLTATTYTGAGATDTASVSRSISFSVVDQAPRPPVVAIPIPDQNATAGVNVNFTFGPGTFTDPDSDPLTYIARLDNNSSLPSWLSFDGTSRSFTGIPPADSPVSLTLKVTANDGQNGSVSDSFVLNVALPAVAGGWQTIVPTTGKPSARFENAYVQAGDRFYLIGGRGIKPVQVYEPIGKTWVNAVATPVDMHHFQAISLDGLIYVVGALTGNFPAEPSIAQIHIYDPKANKWLLGPDIPADRRRGSTGTVAYNNKIYLVGGNTKGHNNGYVNWFDEYDPATGAWRTLPNAPHARDHFQAVIIGNKLYAAGGRRSSANTGQTFMLTVPEVDVYDFATGQWSTNTDPIPTPRGGTSSVVLDGDLVVIGGESALTTSAHKETESMNVNTGAWQQLSNLQEGRHATQAIVNNGGIYIVAGSGAQGSAAISSQEVFFKGSPTTPTGTPITQSQLTAPASVSVGPAAVNSFQNALVTLSNAGGNQAIVVTSVALSGSSEFSYPYPLPIVVPAGQSINLLIRFSPLSAGRKEATVTITHSGTGSSLVVALVGEAIPPNTPPVLSAIGNQTAVAGKALIFTAQAVDTDEPAQNLTYSLAGNAQATINPGTGAFTWTPTTSGSFSLTVKVADNGSPVLTDEEVITVTVSQEVASFSLMNADNEQEIKVITPGEQLNLATLPTRNLNIRANTSPSPVGSVVMVLSGKQSRTQTDNGLPYALFGDSNGDFKNWTPVAGSYNLTGTPYTGTAGTGQAGVPLTVSFTVVDQAQNQPPTLTAIGSQTATVGQPLSFTAQATDADAPAQTLTYTVAGAPSATINPATGAFTWTPANTGTFSVTITVTDNGTPALSARQIISVTVNAAPVVQQAVVSYSLMNADTEQEIRVLTPGEQLNLAILPTRNLNIRTNTNPVTVGSVRMVLSGKQNRTQTETGAPYALFGDVNGNYNPWIPPVGNYTLTTTPYTGASGSGTAGTPLALSFSVVDQAPGGRLPADATPEISGLVVKHYPNPFTRSFTLHLQGKGPGKLPLSIYDIYGRTVYELMDVEPDQTLTLGNEFGPGLYFLQVGTGPAAKRYKLVKVQ